jgi:sugar lactone lactonase YvrE
MMKPNSLFRRLLRTLPSVLLWLAVLPLTALGQANYATPYTFITLAGNSGYGSADGTNGAAQFAFPCSVAVDLAGNVYVADTVNCTIRKMTLVGTNWVVTTLAGLAGCTGTNDGTGSAARFNYPNGVALDSTGNLYVADSGNHTIREVTPVGTNWVVTTLAGLADSAGSANGTNSAAQFNYPAGVAVDTNGNVYVSDTANHTIRKVTPVGTNWVVTTLAGRAGYSGNVDATGSNARFYFPFGLAVTPNGNVYVADEINCSIRKVTPVGTNWVVATLATGFNQPFGVALDRAGNVYVAGTDDHTIRKVTSGGAVMILAGSGSSLSFGTNDGTGSAARFYWPAGVAVDTNGTVYVADSGNNTIRKVTPAGVVTRLAGLAGNNTGSTDGMGSAARFDWPDRVAVDTNGNVYVSDLFNLTIRQVTPAGVVTTLAGLAGHTGTTDGTNSVARFYYPDGVGLDSAGNLYVSDIYNYTIRKVTPVGTNWVVTTLAGLAGSAGSVDGTNKAARFGELRGLAVDSAGDVYVADYGNNTIRKVTPVGTNWVVTTLAGLAGYSGSADGTGSAARFNRPYGVAVDTAGIVYVADSFNSTIRKVTPVGTNWVVTTLAGLAGSAGSVDGTNKAARFAYPVEVAVDMAGNLYVTDQANSTIRKMTPVGTNWVVTTLAGLAGYIAEIDGTGSGARFNSLAGVAVDMAGNVYVADLGNSTIRKGFPASSVPAPILQPPSLSAGQFGFGITGLPGLAVNIESSGNLTDWQVVGTCTLEGGTNSFVSPSPPQGAQFYRAQAR